MTLPNDISRCSNERCERKMKCKRYLDRLPFETYLYADFNEKDCNFFIEEILREKKLHKDIEILESILCVDMKNKSRERKTVEKRQVIMWKLLSMNQYSQSEIGRALGCSHVTVAYSAAKVNDLLSINDATIIRLTNIVSNL